MLALGSQRTGQRFTAYYAEGRKRDHDHLKPYFVYVLATLGCQQK